MLAAVQLGLDGRQLLPRSIHLAAVLVFMTLTLLSDRCYAGLSANSVLFADFAVLTS